MKNENEKKTNYKSGNRNYNKGRSKAKSNKRRFNDKADDLNANRNADAKSTSAQNYAKNFSYSNDPAWYASDPSLARDSASIPFSWATGTTVQFNNFYANTYDESFSGHGLNNTVIPGICALKLSPTVGFTMSKTDPINVAATAVYSFVRHANSGSANYDAPDLMLYILAMGDFIAMLNHFIRVYGTVSLYSSRNRYLPDALLTAMGVNPNIRDNLANFRYILNVICNKASALAVPSTMSYFKRKAFIYSGVYSEGTSAKDQLYLYVPDSYYIYGYGGVGDGRLYNYTYGQDGLLEISDIAKLLDGMLNPLLSSEDIGIMSGDILKAYGTDGIIKFGRLDENYTVIPEFNIGVLEQFKNATCSVASHADIVQSSDKSFLVSDTRIAIPSVWNNATYKDRVQMETSIENRVLVTTTEFVDPSLVLENTRLMVANTYDPTVKALIVNGCTEVPSAIMVYRYQYNPTTHQLTLNQRKFNSYMASPTSSWAAMEMLSAFKFRPAINFVNLNEPVDGAPPVIEGLYRIFDFDNYAVLTSQDIIKMHEAALLNMLFVPSIGSVFGS